MSAIALSRAARRSSSRVDVDYARARCRSSSSFGSPSSACSSRPSPRGGAGTPIQVAIDPRRAARRLRRRGARRRDNQTSTAGLRPASAQGLGRHRRPGPVPPGRDPACSRSRRAHDGRAVSAASAPTRSPRWVPRPRARARRRSPRGPAYATTEVFPLTLFAVGGMMLFLAADDLLTMFVALEVLSLPLYMLVGLARRRRLLSQEASLKYFLLGAFSSAFFLFGMALLYGYAGSVYLRRHRRRRSPTGSSATRTASWCPVSLLVLVGLLFKVGAVPFHSWTPDVYQGAPTPVTGFMAACTKARGLRRDPARGLRRRRRPTAGTGSAVVYRRRDPHDGRRRGALGDPDRHQADARLLLDRPRRVHPRRRAGLRPGRRRRRDVLPGRLRLHDDRRVRASSRLVATRAASEATRTCRSGPAGPRHPVFAGDLRVPAARLRRHPADLGLHREVRGVRAGGRAAARAAPCSWSSSVCCAARSRSFVYVRRDRADVLQRPAGGDDGRWSSTPSVADAASRSPSAPLLTVVLGIVPVVTARAREQRLAVPADDVTA